MAPMDVLNQIFAEKLVDDKRIDDPLFTFHVPIPGGSASCRFLPPDFVFYNQLIVVVLMQAAFNALLGLLVYHILIEPPRIKAIKERADVAAYNPAQFLFAYSFGIPIVVLEPLYMIEFLGIKNAGLRMVFLATPIINSLRITEALYGFTPVAVKKNRFNYIVYFSCIFSIVFDPIASRPKRVSLEFLSKRLKTICRDFIIASIVISILNDCDYEYFNTALPPDSLEHSLADLFSWQHMANNFFVAVLISFSLSQSSTGVSLIYNLLYGYETDEIVHNPMFKSTSPSEFWGRRWNTLVHKGLKNGVYKPMRRFTSSRMMSVFAAFAVSGIIHEFVNFVMFLGRGSYHFSWKQMVFFGWNGVLIALQYCIGHWSIFNWMSRNLPQLVVTMLVLCAALPLAHLFTGDWIRHGYFGAVYIAEPILVCRQLATAG